MELNAGEYRSSAPFTIQDASGGPAFTIMKSGISQTQVGAYPNLCVGTCTKKDPFPLQLSSIKPGEVTSSVTSVTPSSATGTWGDFYDIYITAGAHQSPVTMPREELEIWQNQKNRGFGTPIARGVNLDGRLYDVYLFHTAVAGTVGYVPETMNDNFHGDLLPFIQDSIRRGYAKPSWYLVDVKHGFEIAQGNVIGLGDANFGVTVGGETALATTTAPPPPAPSPSALTPPLPSAVPAPPAPTSMTASLARSLAKRMVASKTHRHPRLKGSCRSVNSTTARCHLAWTVRGNSYTATGNIWDRLSSGTAYWSYNFHGRRTSKRCMLLHPASRTCRRSFHWG